MPDVEVTPDVERLAMWADALESGEFPQGTGVLHSCGDPDRFCCLGVACEAAIRDGVALTVTTDGDKIDEWFRYDGAGAYLPPAVQAWLGVSTHNPVLAGDTATSWNDDCMATFPEIAALIRREYGLEDATPGN